MKKKIPNLGIGVGLRLPHYKDILEKKPEIDWFEIISENFMVEGGKPLAFLKEIVERYPVVQHGVSLAIGSPDPLDFNYLKKLKNLTKITKTPWVSDHLCWGGFRAHTTTIFCLYPIHRKLSTMLQIVHVLSKTI
jgi:uncharacterized protein (UPF0276 family)